MAISPGAGVEDGDSVGGRGVRVAGGGRSVEVGAGRMVRAEVDAAIPALEGTAGRINRIYARLPHISSKAITTIAIRTLPVSIFFILHR
jgi:hypothetical protein